jgi:hypothetical protein
LKSRKFTQDFIGVTTAVQVAKLALEARTSAAAQMPDLPPLQRFEGHLFSL